MKPKRIFAAVVAFFVMVSGAMLAVSVSASTSGPDGDCDSSAEE